MRKLTFFYVVIHDEKVENGREPFGPRWQNETALTQMTTYYILTFNLEYQYFLNRIKQYLYIIFQALPYHLVHPVQLQL